MGFFGLLKQTVDAVNAPSVERTSKSRFRSLLLLRDVTCIIILCFLATGRSLDTVSWTEKTSGIWSNATLWYHPWSPGSLPFPGSDVIVSPQTASTGTFKITMGSSITCRALVFNQKIIVTGNLIVERPKACRENQVFDPVTSKCVNTTVETVVSPTCGPDSGSTPVSVSGKDLAILGNRENVTIEFFHLQSAETYTVQGTRLGISSVELVTPAFNPGTTRISVHGIAGSVRNATDYLYYPKNATLLSVYPPLALFSGGTTIKIFELGIPESSLPVAKIRLRDTIGNVSTAIPTLLGNNTVTFIAPSFAGVSLDQPAIPVKLEIAPNGIQYLESSLTFRYYNLPQVTAVIPKQVPTYGGVNITVHGGGYFNSKFIKCQFYATDGSLSYGKGYYISIDSIICAVPAFGRSQIVDVEVSMDDGQVFTSSSGVKLVMVEYVSQECRMKTELPSFVGDRNQLELHYFPNLAINAEVATSARRDNYESSIGRALSPVQIVDGDRCCDYTLESIGYKCGVVFDTNSSSIELAQVTVDIQYPAYVNEILNTWYRPCKNLPDPGYTIETRSNITGQWNKLLERAAWKENPCRTLTGDTGPTAFCADFFEPIVAQQFRLTFNNSVDHFLVGAGTDGGWLMEFEVHGIYLKTPYKLNYIGQPLAVQSGINVHVPSMVVQSLSILNGQMNGSDPETSRPVSLSMPFLSPHVVTQVQGKYNFSDVTLVRPLAGTYSLLFTSPGLKSTNVTIIVSQGTAVSLNAEWKDPSTPYPSAETVTLRPIIVKARDEGSNWCDQDSLIRLVAVNSTMTVTGYSAANMTGGYVLFTGIKLTKPVVGTHWLEFQTNGLKKASLSVSIGVGEAFELAFEPFIMNPCPSEERVGIPTLNVRIRDAGGAQTTAALEVRVKLVGTGSTLLGNVSVTSENGVAVFSSLQLVAPFAGVYKLQFTAPLLTLSPTLNATIMIVPGPAKSIYIRNVEAVSTVYSSAAISMIDPIVIGAKDAGGNVVHVDRIVVASLNPHSEILSGTSIVEMRNGTALISNLTLSNPMSGAYQLNFSAAGVDSTAISLKILPGLARSLRIIEGGNQTHASVELVSLSTITLRAIDAGGSFAVSGRKGGDSVDPTILVSCNDLVLQGTVSAKMDSNGSVIFDQVKIAAPKAGAYQLQFTSSNSLVATNSFMNIRIGAPVKLKTGSYDHTPLQSDDSVSIPSIQVQVLDAGGSVVPNAMIDINVILSSGILVDNMNATRKSSFGIATFSGMSMVAPQANVYQLRFTSAGMTEIVNNITVVPGTPKSLYVHAVPALEYGSAVHTSIQSLLVGSKDAGGNIVYPNGIVQCLLSPNPNMLTGITVFDMTNGVATISNLSISSPPSGKYWLNFTMIGVERTALGISIVPGVAASLQLVRGDNDTHDSMESVPIGTINLEAIDAGGSFAVSGRRYGDVDDPTVTVSCHELSFDGIITVKMAPNGSVSFDQIKLKAPKSGIYELEFTSSNNLITITTIIRVTVGPPYRLTAIPIDSSTCNPSCINPGSVLCCRSHETTRMPSIAVRAVDAGGDFVGSKQVQAVIVRALFTTNGTQPVVWSGNTSVPMISGESIFTNLVLHSALVGRYYLNFSADSLLGVRLSLDIQVGDAAGLSIIKGPTQTPYPCSTNTMLNDVEVQLLDAGGTQISSLTSAFALALKVTRADGKEEVIATTNSNVDISTGIATWTGLNAKSPTVGTLTVLVTGILSNAERYAFFNISITNGPAVGIKLVNTPATTLQGDAMVPIPSLLVYEYDAGGNRAMTGPYSSRTVTASLPSSTLVGNKTFSMTLGECAISGLSLKSPKKYNSPFKLLINATGGLLPYTLSIDVVSGPAKQLAVQTAKQLTSDNETPLPQIDLGLFDGAGNPVDFSSSASFILSLHGGRAVPEYSAPLQYTIAGPIASITDLIVKGYRGDIIELTFRLNPSTPMISTNLTIQISSCNSKPGSTPGGNKGQSCSCRKGYNPSATGEECVMCAAGKFKAEKGDGKCEPCPPNMMSKPGVPSIDWCKCSSGYYYDASKGSCLGCDLSKAVCNGGDTEMVASKPRTTLNTGPIYPKPGFWRPTNAKSIADIVECGSLVSCPGGNITVNDGCATNYTGPLCSYCVADFAHQGDVCYPCSDESLNVFIVICFIIVVLFAARWYVNKQMQGGRSPEGTILKLLLAYVQVLGFVGRFPADWKEGMKAFYVATGVVSNLDVFQLQPIDCTVGQSDYYLRFWFYLCLIPMSFIGPAIMYHIGTLKCWKIVQQIRRRKADEMSVRAKRGISTYLDQIKSSNQSEPQHEQDKSGGKLRTVFWPLTFFFCILIPGIPSSIRRLWQQLSQSTGPKMNHIKNKICGDHLDVPPDEQQDENDQQTRQRRATDFDDNVAAQVRAQAKSTGGVLFEQDPLLGRSAMSATKGAFWVVFFMMLPTILKNTMELFDCQEIGRDRLLSRDLKIKCDDGVYENMQYVFYFALVPIVLILILYVVYKNVFLRKRRELVRYLPIYNLCWEDSMGYLRLPIGVDTATANVLRSEKKLLRRLRKYLFLFSGYRTEGLLYMWDLVIMMRKILIAVILVYCREKVALQIFYSLIVFVVSLVAHLIFQPFDDDYARKKKMIVLPSTLEFISIFATILTLMCGMLFHLKESVLTKNQLQVLDWLLFCFNALVLLSFFYLLTRSVTSRFIGKIGSWSKRFVDSQASQQAARWWSGKIRCCSWGTKRQTETAEVVEAIQMNEINVDTLPSGWEAVVDRKSGKTYYQNRERKVTQWEKPVDGEAQKL